MDGLTLGQMTAHGFVKKQSAEFIGKANLNSPIFIGNPTGPTAASGTNSGDLATTAFVQREKESLLTINQQLHIGTVVKAIVYDTSKDSDGGAWRKRCQDKSWYTEALGGDSWMPGGFVDSSVVRLAGGSTGTVYVNSNDKKFYSLLPTTGAVEVFRGITREFPAVAGIVAESARVVIYDLRDGSMWMVFTTGGNNSFNYLYYNTGTQLSAIAAMNGALFMGQGNTSAVSCLASFVKDCGYQFWGGNTKLNTNVASRNVATSYTTSTEVAASALAHRQVNDVAITVLDNSPIDPATGLPVPTIAVFSAGGVNVIKNDGTVILGGLGGNSSFGGIDPDGRLFSYNTPNGKLLRHGYVKDLAGGFMHEDYSAITTIPAVLGTLSKGANLRFASSTGLTVLKENPTTKAKGMVAYITNAYNTGWQVGDIRGAYLAGTVAETIVDSGELVTDGAFSADTDWTKASGVTISGGAAQFDAVTSYGNGTMLLVPIIPVPAILGKTYLVQFTLSSATLGVSVNFGGVSGTPRTLAGTYTEYVTAVSIGGLTVSCRNNDGVRTGSIDNISVKLAEPDRSVKNQGLIVNGTLTKAPVAAGSNLVAYSGFSAANYLEQPYNSQLDFGTGDFCVMGWVNVTSQANQILFDRGSAGAGRIVISLNTTFTYGCSATAGTSATSVASSNGLYHVALYRASGVLYFAANGVVVSLGANTQNVSNAVATTCIGIAYDHATAQALGSLALWRISATAPSADQIAQIYRNELPLFQAGAQCTIAGTSPAVTALAYDDATDLLHVGTSWGRSSFKDLVRTDSEATTVGTVTSLSASGGTIVTGGTNAKIYSPTKYLRDELSKLTSKNNQSSTNLIPLTIVATSGQTVFTATMGYDVDHVYINGLYKIPTDDYTLSTDGFRNYVTMTIGVPINQKVTLMLKRSK